jgi:hypothetical protein
MITSNDQTPKDITEVDSSAGVVCAAPAGYAGPERTRWAQSTPPKPDDTFTRLQVIQYLEEIPLGYRTQGEHEITEKLIERAQRHFAQLDAKWEPSID